VTPPRDAVLRRREEQPDLGSVPVRDHLHGIAVANPTVYLDTWPNGDANKTALIEIQPGGTVRVLWQS